MKSQLIRVLKIIIPLIIGVYLMWYFWDNMSEKDRESFFRALNEANYFWFFLSLIFSFLSHLSRAIRWRYMLEPLGYKTKLKNRYHSLMIGYIMNLLIPRAGEASRAGVLYQTEKVPFTKSFGTIIAERVFDLIMLGVVVLLALFFSYDDLMEIASKNGLFNRESETGGIALGWIALVVFLVFCIAGILVWKFVPKVKEKLIGFIKDIVAGVFSVFKSNHPWRFLGHTLFIWTIYVSFFGLCFLSLESTKVVPFGGVLIGFIAGTLGIMFTNGGMGAYPMLVGMVITYYLGETLGEDEAKGVGNALGMMIWSTQTVMMIVLGLLSLLLVQRSKKSET
ncbi:MAG: flippase-like domain-containing protein [Flavobacteriales bacterium]|nr:flippase-like domain-containing protein [Flavobacteriales bacterium]